MEIVGLLRDFLAYSNKETVPQKVVILVPEYWIIHVSYYGDSNMVFLRFTWDKQLA